LFSLWVSRSVCIKQRRILSISPADIHPLTHLARLFNPPTNQLHRPNIRDRNYTHSPSNTLSIKRKLNDHSLHRTAPNPPTKSHPRLQNALCEDIDDRIPKLAKNIDMQPPSNKDQANDKPRIVAHRNYSDYKFLEKIKREFVEEMVQREKKKMEEEKEKEEEEVEEEEAWEKEDRYDKHKVIERVLKKGMQKEREEARMEKEREVMRMEVGMEKGKDKVGGASEAYWFDARFWRLW